MDHFSYYVGGPDAFAQFMEVTPRPATPDEAMLYEGIVNVYEVEVDQDQTLRAFHSQLVEGGDEYITVEMFIKGRLVFSQSLDCFRIFVDKSDTGEVFLVLREGSINLYIHKNPWRVSMDQSSYYKDPFDDDY